MKEKKNRKKGRDIMDERGLKSNRCNSQYEVKSEKVKVFLLGSYITA